ncbi:MAG: hypothetical protein WC305_06280 [Bacteroidales bacterium]|jgi:hypothetical protein|nr:hypothetical protein [Candidatus Paceibacterota bacterium]
MTGKEFNKIKNMKTHYLENTVTLITRKDYDKLFIGRHNLNIYYQKLLSIYFFMYPKQLINEKYIYYENVKAIKELGLSERQITDCRKILIKEGWISVKKEFIDGKQRHLILINMLFLEQKLKENNSIIEL